MRRSLLPACLAAAVLIISGLAGASAAGAATLRGRIVGEPQVSGVHAQVPLALANGSVAVLTVPAKSGFRTVTTGRTRADRTRLGDVVSARVRSLKGARAKAKYLVITQRSVAPPFDVLHALLAAASKGARSAAGEVAGIAKAEASGPTDPAVLRLAMLEFRAQLNDLINGLRDQADNMDKVQDAVKSAKALVRELAGASAVAREAATKLENGVTGLDEFINSIGGSSSDPLPVGSVSEVSQVINLAIETIDGLDPVDNDPGGPRLPDPLGGVPVPTVPVLPG